MDDIVGNYWLIFIILNSDNPYNVSLDDMQQNAQYDTL